MPTRVFYSFTPEKCIITRENIATKPAKIKVLDSEYHDSAEQNFNKLVVVVWTSKVAKEFWKDKMEKSTRYFGFTRLVERDGIGENAHRCLDGIDVDELHSILEVGETAQSLLQNQIGEAERDKICFCPLPTGIPLMHPYEAMWPEKKAREQLLDEILSWVESGESKKEMNDSTSPPQWVEKAKIVCGIDDISENASKNLCIVYNPVSGTRRSKIFLAEVILPMLKLFGYKNFDLQETLYNGHCEKLVAELDLKKYDAIFTCGGDGTHAMSLRGLRNNKSLPDGINGLSFPMAMIPTGSGGWTSSIYHEHITLLQNGHRVVIDAVLRASGMKNTTKFPSMKYEYTDFEDNSTTDVSSCVFILGTMTTRIYISDAIREIDDSLGLARYHTAGNINMLCWENIQCEMHYLPYDCETPAPTLENWDTTGKDWETHKGGFADIVSWACIALDDPRANKIDMQGEYFYIYLMRPMSTDEYRKYELMSGRPFWEFFSKIPEQVSMVKVKAFEFIAPPNIEKSNQWRYGLNLDGEACGNVKRARIITGDKCTFLDHDPTHEKQLAESYGF